MRVCALQILSRLKTKKKNRPLQVLHKLRLSPKSGLNQEVHRLIQPRKPCEGHREVPTGQKTMEKERRLRVRLLRDTPQDVENAVA